MSDVTWSALRREAADRLTKLGVASPEAEARWLVEEAAADVDEPVTTRAIVHFDAMLARREAGEPLQYVLGHWAFRSLDLLVDRRVLIPRPETEVVAGAAIDEARRLDARLADALAGDLDDVVAALAADERARQLADDEP